MILNSREGATEIFKPARLTLFDTSYRYNEVECLVLGSAEAIHEIVEEWVGIRIIPT